MRTLFAILLLTASATLAQNPAAPTIDDLINLKRVAAPAVSPNGQLKKPKANRAAMQQNLDWFTRYIWNQPTGTQQ